MYLGFAVQFNKICTLLYICALLDLCVDAQWVVIKAIKQSSVVVFSLTSRIKGKHEKLIFIIDTARRFNFSTSLILLIRTEYHNDFLRWKKISNIYYKIKITITNNDYRGCSINNIFRIQERLRNSEGEEGGNIKKKKKI